MENNEQLNEALELIAKEDFIKAQAILKDIILKEPENIEAYKNLGLCEVNLDNPPEAIKAFQKVIEFNKDDALSLFYLANCYNSTGDKELALETFAHVLELRPDYLDAYKSMAMIYIEFSQVDLAIETIKKALLNPSIEADYSAYYILATSYLLKKDYINAIENLEKSLELNPEHLGIMNSLGVSYMNIQEFDKAKDILLKAYELDNENSLSAYNLGILYQTLNDYKKALEYFQISYRLDASISMLSTLASCALKAEEYEMASTLYQNLVMTYPNNSLFRISYIEALEMTQNYKEALENVNLLLAVDEKNISLIKKKGTLLRKLKFYPESIETFNILVKRGRIDVEVYYNLAFNYVEMEDFDNAKEMFKKCITLEPQNPYAHKDLAILYLKMNCYDWALDELKEAISIEGDVAEFHYSLGVCNMMLSKIDEAKEEFNKTLELEPENADCLAYLGYVYLIEHDYNEANELLQKAIKIEPDNFLAKTYMAKYYFQEQKYDIAMLFLMDVAEKSQDDETLNMLAVCFIKTNDYKEASGILSKLVLKYPKNHILLTDLATCEYKTGKKDEAIEHLRQALMIYEDFEDALNLLKEINNAK